MNRYALVMYWIISITFKIGQVPCFEHAVGLVKSITDYIFFENQNYPSLPLILGNFRRYKIVTFFYINCWLVSALYTLKVECSYTTCWQSFCV